MPPPDNTTLWIQNHLDLIAAGQDARAVRDELLRRASRRIMHLVQAAIRAHPGLGRWEQDEDVLQEVLLRLDRAIRDAKPANTGQFFVIVAQHVRWATIDLLRHHFGPEGGGRHHHSGGLDAVGEPIEPSVSGTHPLDAIKLHEAVDRLPKNESDAWHLVKYLDLTHMEAAESLGVDTKTIQRRTGAAKSRLARDLDDFDPDAG